MSSTSKLPLPLQKMLIVGRVLRKIPTRHGHARIEDHRDFLSEALREAFSLLGPVKRCCDGFPTRDSILSDVL